jgi:hypothetical protein
MIAASITGPFVSPALPSLGLPYVDKNEKSIVDQSDSNKTEQYANTSARHCPYIV